MDTLVNQPVGGVAPQCVRKRSCLFSSVATASKILAFTKAKQRRLCAGPHVSSSSSVAIPVAAPVENVSRDASIWHVFTRASASWSALINLCSLAIAMAPLVRDHVRTRAATADVRKNVGNPAFHAMSPVPGNALIRDAVSVAMSHVIVHPATNHVQRPSIVATRASVCVVKNVLANAQHVIQSISPG